MTRCESFRMVRGRDQHGVSGGSCVRQEGRTNRSAVRDQQPEACLSTIAILDSNHYLMDYGPPHSPSRVDRRPHRSFPAPTCPLARVDSTGMMCNPPRHPTFCLLSSPRMARTSPDRCPSDLSIANTGNTGLRVHMHEWQVPEQKRAKGKQLHIYRTTKRSRTDEKGVLCGSLHVQAVKLPAPEGGVEVCFFFH
jgi:hypothetical protein